MRSVFARTLLILTALWLPLQAVAGLTMKLGMADAVPASVQTAAAETAACPYHHAAAAAPATPVPSHQQACDNCGVCHLAATGYMPAAATLAVILPLAQAFLPAPAVEQSSHIPEPPQYPPKRSA
ncbi:MAG: hypothetical protein PHY45_15125 [Rhodocyclaceae bacterium]|nr:hypothetical protein [Rhodocyclaceae bacterium]